MTRPRAIQAGLILGIFCAALVLPFGLDAPQWLLPWTPQAVAPATLYLVTAPVGMLPPTLALAVFSALSLAGFLALAEIAGISPLWAAGMAPAVYTLWLGQLGGFVALGAALGLLSLKNKLPYGCAGLAVLLLLVKPQAGGLMALYVLWDLLRRDRMRFYGALYAICAVLLLSAMVFGAWLGPWLDWIGYRGVAESSENLGLGLLAAPLLLLVLLPVPPTRKAVLLLTITPLLSPYVQHYDFAALAIASGQPWLSVWSWLASTLRITTGLVAWLWWIPLGALGWWMWAEARGLEGVPRWQPTTV